MLKEDVIEVIVQVNGKLRGKFTSEVGSDEDIRKVIVVKGKVVNIVAN